MKKERKYIVPILIVGLLVAILLSTMGGRYPISSADLFRLFYEKLSGISSGVDEVTKMVFWEVRFPRMMAAVLIGAALAVSGASYQGILRNPMVAPDILGASSGASFGAAVGILFGCNALTIQLLAFAGGLTAVGITFIVSHSAGDRGSILMLVLAGMVVTSLFSAGISIIKYLGDPYDTLPALTFWLMGGLTYVTQQDVWILMIPFLIGVIPLQLLRWKMNILCFQDEEAESMGIDAKKTRGMVILFATLLTSSSVAVGGMIGWIGLVIPHICRMLAGPDYRKLLPATMVSGALFLLLVDDLARCLSAQELPLGVLTAVIGAPCFLFQLYKGRRGFI